MLNQDIATALVNALINANTMWNNEGNERISFGFIPIQPEWNLNKEATHIRFIYNFYNVALSLDGKDFGTTWYNVDVTSTTYTFTDKHNSKPPITVIL